MARSYLSIGASANDGSGDTLRSGGTKINANFQEIYLKLGADSDALMTNVSFTATNMLMTDSAYTLTVGHDALNSDETIEFPSLSGIVALADATQTLTNKTLTTPLITNPVLQDSASAVSQYTLLPGNLAADHNIRLPVLADSDTFVFLGATQTLTAKTLTTPVITTPKVGTSINDTSGNELIKVTATGSAVNEITLANAATGGGPTVTASGGDTNIPINIVAKGSSSITISKLAVNEIVQTGNGAASAVKSFIIGNKGSALAVSLADGTTVGELKYFVNIGAGVMTVTPANYGQGTTFALAQHDGCTAIWQGANWYLVGNQGEVTVA